MTHSFEPNAGDHPSHLQLARYATDELHGEEGATIAAWLSDHPEGRAWLEELERARGEVPAFDADALRLRSQQPLEESHEVPQPANRSFSMRLLAPILLAAVALLVALPIALHTPDEVRPDIQFRGDASLFVYQQGAALLTPYDGEALAEGDALGFEVYAGGHGDLVLLSVDGVGAVSVFYPAHGDVAEPLPEADAKVQLPETIVLDDAPGPEVFVAVFGSTVSEARADVAQAWQSGGEVALVAWAQTQSEVDAVVVARR